MSDEILPPLLYKYCTYCETDHPLTSAYWSGVGRNPRCKYQTKTRRLNNLEEARCKDRERKRIQRLNNPEGHKAATKRYYEKHKEDLKAKHKAYVQANIETLRTKRKQYWADNRSLMAERKRARIAKSRARDRERYKTDIKFVLTKRLRVRLRKALKGNYKKGSAIRDLGCSVDELKIHLESKFTKGMSWDNYGEWHIDHIRPLSSFDLTDAEQLKQACHYTNLQPLWAADNLSKGNSQ